MIEQAGAGAHCDIDRSRVDLAALNVLTYGLYVLTARDADQRNACENQSYLSNHFSFSIVNS